jgi:hypothetical protein
MPRNAVPGLQRKLNQRQLPLFSASEPSSDLPMLRKRNYAFMMDIDEQSSPSQPSTRQLRSTMPLHGTPEPEPESRDVYLAWVVQGSDDFDNVHHVSPHSLALLTVLFRRPFHLNCLLACSRMSFSRR